MESYPELFDGGVDWEGTFVEAAIPNLLSTLPPALLNYPDYVASGFDPHSTAAKNILAAGYPPDLTTAEGGTTISLWGLHYMQFWEVTMCQWQKRLDPAYNTYEVQNGNHIETFRLTFPQLELIQPHAQHAFDLLISAIENYAELPPSQCIPRGSTIDKNPPQPGHCTNLLVP